MPLEPKLLLELTRGATLAVHAAAGSARGHCAARLLRAAEGLCRSAAALLQLPPGDGTHKKGKGKDNGNDDKDKKKDKKRKEKKDAAEDKDEVVQAPGAQRRRRRRRRAPAAAPADGPDADFDDYWADGVVAFGPAAAPPGWPLLAQPALPAPAAAAAEAAPQPRQPLLASRPGSRSPRRSAPLALVAGRLATLQHLVNRPELEHALVELTEFDAPADRWVCRDARGVSFRVRAEKLLPVPEEGQQFQRLRFANG